jgi:hypothetical protein
MLTAATIVHNAHLARTIWTYRRRAYFAELRKPDAKIFAIRDIPRACSA